MSLQVLACGACGGQVPLADGESVPCPFCAAAVAIPLEHRALRDAERRDAAARTEAAALFARWGRPPSLALRVAAVVFHPWFLVLDGLFLLLLAVMLGIMVVGSLLGPLVHANLWDVIPDAPKGYGLFVLSAGSVLAGIALGVYGRRRLLASRSLQAALAARPPTRAGESAQCRSCGAPLAVPAGADGVRCAYCKADNLVSVPAAWLAGVAADAARVGKEIEQAAAWLREETARVRRSLYKHLLIAGGVLLGFILLVALKGSTPDWRSSWSEYVKPPRTLVRLYGGDVHGDRREVALGAACQPEAISVLSEECAGGACRVWLYAALREGERLTLRSDDLPAGARVRAVLHSHFWWGKGLSEGFGTELAEAPLNELTFTAPWSAWYQLRVEYPGAAGKPTLCAGLAPPQP